MSDLRKAAQDVVTVWKMHGTAESLRGWINILKAALAESERDWSMLEATQESLREHMAKIHRLRAALAQEPFALPCPTPKARREHCCQGDCIPRTAPPQQAEPVTDPFADIRDKRISELNMEQRDRATELWLREQIGPQEDYWYPHLQTLFRIIDRLREQPEHDPALSAALGWPGGISDPVLDRKTLLQQVAALAQEQEQPEPVAWMVEGSLYASKEVAQKMGGNAYTLQALYTAPPQRPPLTDEEIRAHADKHLHYQPQSYEASGVFDLVRAIERKVRGE